MKLSGQEIFKIARILKLATTELIEVVVGKSKPVQLGGLKVYICFVYI